jgi:hypothetical protein
MDTIQSQNKNNRDQDQDMSLDINIHTDGKPIHVIRCGNIKAACWLNDGMSGRFFSTGIARVYRDKSKQEWGQSHAFTDTRDLLTVAYVAQEMCRWICDNKRVVSVETESDDEETSSDS